MSEETDRYSISFCGKKRTYDRTVSTETIMKESDVGSKELARIKSELSFGKQTSSNDLQSLKKLVDNLWEMVLARGLTDKVINISILDEELKGELNDDVYLRGEELFR